MIVTILILVLMIIGMALFLFFLFTFYLPSLSGKKGNTIDLLFTREQIDREKGLSAFRWTRERVDYAGDREGRLFFSLYFRSVRRPASPEKQEARREKDFQFWKKCYTILAGCP